MNEAQALQVCGCFASGLDVGFYIEKKYYCIHKSDVYEHELSITEDISSDHETILYFEVLDVSVNDGCLVIDLYDFQMRIDLEEGA